MMLSSTSCPPKKGKPGKRKGKAVASAPLHRTRVGENLSRLKRFSSSSSLHSNGNYLLPARPLLLDANMLDANIPSRKRLPRGKREKAVPGSPVSACTANIDDSLTV